MNKEAAEVKPPQNSCIFCNELVWLAITTGCYDGALLANQSTKKENQKYLEVNKKYNDGFYRRYKQLIKELKL